MEDVAVEDERQPPVVYFHGEEDKQSDMSEDEMDAQLNDVSESYGVRLNEQLRAAADAHARGQPVIFDEQWEQWMKEALERNDLGVDAIMDAIRDGRPFPASPSANSEALADPFTGTSRPQESPSTTTEVQETLVSQAMASTSTQTTPRLSHTQEAMVSSLRRLESRMDDIITPVGTGTVEQL